MQPGRRARAAGDGGRGGRSIALRHQLNAELVEACGSRASIPLEALTPLDDHRQPLRARRRSGQEHLPGGALHVHGRVPQAPRQRGVPRAVRRRAQLLPQPDGRGHRQLARAAEVHLRERRPRPAARSTRARSAFLRDKGLDITRHSPEGDRPDPPPRPLPDHRGARRRRRSRCSRRRPPRWSASTGRRRSLAAQGLGRRGAGRLRGDLRSSSPATSRTWSRPSWATPSNSRDLIDCKETLMNRVATAHARWSLLAALAGAGALAACERQAAQGGQPAAAPSIQNIGSDTMVNLAQAWAEEYAQGRAAASRSRCRAAARASGIAALINGTAEIANSSRKLEPEEIEKAKQKNGQEPQGVHGRLRRARHLRPQGQPARRDQHGGAGRDLHGGRQDRQVVASSA